MYSACIDSVMANYILHDAQTWQSIEVVRHCRILARGKRCYHSDQVPVEIAELMQGPANEKRNLHRLIEESPSFEQKKTTLFIELCHF
jgi:hypothetical protein